MEEPQRGGLCFGVVQHSQVLDQVIVVVLDEVIELTQLDFEFRRAQEEIDQIICHARDLGQLEIHEICLDRFGRLVLVLKHDVAGPAISMIQSIEVLRIGRVHSIHKVDDFRLHLVLYK